MRKVKRGISMIEILLVLLIISVLVIVVFFAAHMGEESGVVSNEKQNLSLLQTGVRNVFDGGNNFNGVNNKLILDANVIPDQMRGLDNGQILSKWGEVILTSHRIKNEADSYEIRYNHVPKVYCVKLVSLMASSFSEIMVNDLMVKNIDNPIENVAQIVSACGVSETDNVLTFIGR